MLVSGSKMDDQWPQRSQRSKMTITLKCNLCGPSPASPLPPAGGAGAAGHGVPCSHCHTRLLSAMLPAQPSTRAVAFGHQGLCVCLSIWLSPSLVPVSSLAENPHICPPLPSLMKFHMGLQKCRAEVLLATPLPLFIKQTLVSSALNACSSFSVQAVRGHCLSSAIVRKDEGGSLLFHT